MLGASLNAAVGRGAILLGLLVCLFGIGITIAGIRQGNLKALRSSAYYAYAAFGAALLAFVIMERAIITRDFSLAYVQQVGSRDTPALYNFAALWSALEGSLLMWVLILTGFSLTKDANVLEGGKVYDPNNGKTYCGKLTLKEKVIDLRGYICSMSFLGRTSQWTLAE